MAARPLLPLAAALAIAVAPPAAAFEDVNMDTSVRVDGQGNVVVGWSNRGFDAYHVGWRVNGGARGERSRPGDKTFTVLMHYTPGAVYQVEVQGCTKHALGHDQCTSWDRAECGAAASPCEGTPQAAAKRRRGYTY